MGFCVKKGSGNEMSDTIAAISTPAGAGGIGIVRVSGPEALDIMHKIMRNCPDEVEPRHAYYGEAVNSDTGDTIDEAIFIYMNAPHTYTREDILEVQAHGSAVSLRAILREMINLGARLAEPGEFTKLAFLNGRIDLAQAEAVIDIINAKSEVPERMAVKQLEGRLSTEVKSIRTVLTDLLAEMAVNIDFPDEDIEEFTYDNFATALDKVQIRLHKLLETADQGKIARDGLKIAIVGKPNVGKSSLMNALLGENRVIVTSVPGTTRDTVEETISVDGIPIVLVDTAGMHESSDLVESIGINKSKQELEEADMIIFVLDGSEVPAQEDLDIAKAIIDASGDRYGLGRETMHPFGSKRVIAVLNKRDLGCEITEESMREMLGVSAQSEDLGVAETSMVESADDTETDSGNENGKSGKYGYGAEPVLNELKKMLEKGELLVDNDVTITNERHREALIVANASIIESIHLLRNHEPLEIAEVETRSAYNKLGEIIGETAGEEILDAVFSRFCLGK